MNIVIALTYYTPHWTGLTEHASRLAEGLVSKGHAVTVVCSQHKKNLPVREVLDGVCVIRTPIIGTLSRSVLSLTFIPQVLWRARKAEVVLLYTPLAEILLLCFLLRLLGIRSIIIHNGDLLLPKGLLNRLLELFFAISMRLSGMLVNGIISYSDDYTNHSTFLRHFKGKAKSILPLFPRKHVNERHLSLPVNRNPIIGFAGRFVEEKGFDILLDAIPIVAKVYPKVLFVFAGEQHITYETFHQKNRKKIEKVKDNLLTLGLLDQTNMHSFYKALDLFVLPSRSDCLAFVQVEAMLSGVPVVSTNIPGARIAVQQTGMGLLVQSEHVEDLARGIIKLYENKNYYRKKIHAAQTLFNYNKTLQEYNEYITIVAKKV